MAAFFNRKCNLTDIFVKAQMNEPGFFLERFNSKQLEHISCGLQSPSFCCDIKNGCVTSKHKTSLEDFSPVVKLKLVLSKCKEILLIDTHILSRHSTLRPSD